MSFARCQMAKNKIRKSNNHQRVHHVCVCVCAFDCSSKQSLCETRQKLTGFRVMIFQWKLSLSLSLSRQPVVIYILCCYLANNDSLAGDINQPHTNTGIYILTGWLFSLSYSSWSYARLTHTHWLILFCAIWHCVYGIFSVGWGCSLSLSNAVYTQARVAQRSPPRLYNNSLGLYSRLTYIPLSPLYMRESIRRRLSA